MLIFFIINNDLLIHRQAKIYDKMAPGNIHKHFQKQIWLFGARNAADKTIKTQSTSNQILSVPKLSYVNLQKF